MSAARTAATLVPAQAITSTRPVAPSSNGRLATMLFDPDWYLRRYPDVAASGVDPIRHYLTNGAAEGRNPNPRFNTNRYLRNNPDVRASGMNPFMHFMLYGFREGRLAR